MEWLRKKGRTRSKSSIRASGGSGSPLTKTKSESSMMHKLRKSTSTYDFFKPKHSSSSSSRSKTKSKSRSRLTIRHRRSSSEGPAPSPSALSSRFDPPKDMLGNMTDKFVSRMDKGTVWIDLPRLCHKFRVIDARLPSEGAATVSASAEPLPSDLPSGPIHSSGLSVGSSAKVTVAPSLSEMVSIEDDDSGHPLDGRSHVPMSTRETSMSPGFPDRKPKLVETQSEDHKTAMEMSIPSITSVPSLPSLVQSTTESGITVIGPDTWHGFEHTAYFDGTVPRPPSSPTGRRGGKNVVSLLSGVGDMNSTVTTIDSAGSDAGSSDGGGSSSPEPSVGAKSTSLGQRTAEYGTELTVDEEKKVEESISLNMSVDDEETLEEQCQRLWKHWEIICKLLKELTSLCDECQDSSGSMMSLSEQLDEQIQQRSKLFRSDHRNMANCDFPSVLNEMFEGSPSLATSVVLSVLCLCTQRIVFEPVFRISREVIKTAKLSDYRGKGSWFIDITFLPKNEVRVRHRRRGAVKEDPRDKSQWAIVSWEVDMRVKVDSKDLANSRCVSRKIRITGVEFNDGCAYEFKRKWRHKLCGGSMTLP